MKPINVKMYWAELCSYSVGGAIHSHVHDFFHYIYVIDGGGIININDREYELSPENIYLISPGHEHSFFNTFEKPLTTYELKFTFYDPELMKRICVLPAFINVGGTPIPHIIETIWSEAKQKESFYEDLISLNTQELLLHLQRRANLQSSDLIVGKDFSDVLRFIDANFNRSVKLEELADIVHLEKTYFVKKFKQFTGSTPITYINNLRLKKAKAMLRYSDMNVTQIADAVGFGSVHHFSKAFTSKVGISPSDYKKENSIE